MTFGTVILALISAVFMSILPVFILSWVLHVESDQGQKLLWGIVVLSLAGLMIYPQYKEKQETTSLSNDNMQVVTTSQPASTPQSVTKKQTTPTPVPSVSIPDHAVKPIPSFQVSAVKSTYSPQGMYDLMTYKPYGAGIKQCGYSKTWKTFGIRFTVNKDRFYVYFDFPESEYNNMINAQDPYKYYCDNIRGHYGTAEKYYLPLDNNTTSISSNHKVDVPEINSIDDIAEMYGDESSAFSDWLLENEGMSVDEYRFRREYGDDYVEKLHDEYGVDEPWIYEEFWD